MKIHYITVHHGTEKWIDMQLEHINFFSKNHKVWALFSEDIPLEPHKSKFHFLAHKKYEGNNPSRDHWQALNFLANLICKDKNTKDGDVLVFLDSDSLLISNARPFINYRMRSSAFHAVIRTENENNPSPQPLFAFCSAGFWRSHKLSWTNSNKKKKNFDWEKDTGAFLLEYFKRHDIKWGKIRLNQSKSLFVDKILFTVYGQIVYHHGGASRGVFINRSTPKAMLEEKNHDFYQDIFKKIGNHIFNTLKSGFFLKTNDKS